MASSQILYSDFIRLRKNQELTNVYDIEMRHIDYLKNYDSVECHVVIYPYSRKICSKNIVFCPFEEYVKDILTHQKSAYMKLTSYLNKMFALFLGFMITIIFLKFKPDDLFSVESIVSIFGAYFIGKEVWDDIEKLLINLSKTWSLRYQTSYYLYQLEKHTTLSHYSHFAKKQRYGKTPLLPEKIDFIEQSNSQTIRMYFNMKDIQPVDGFSGHLFSIHVDPQLVLDFEEDGCMFGVKLSFNKHSFGLVKHFELFQSLHNNSKGCVDEHGQWIENTVFYRTTFTMGRLKLFLKHGLLYQQTIIG